jgi:hypothetical protein
MTHQGSINARSNYPDKFRKITFNGGKISIFFLITMRRGGSSACP